MNREEMAVPRGPLVFYVRLRVKPECVDAWLQAVHDIVDAMSKEDTFLSCALHRDANDPTLFALYERWAEPDVATFLARQDKPYRRDYEARLPDLLQGPREPQVLVPLAEWPQADQSGTA
ncbi:antibiotic biosynthesis monooxygenase [Pseudoxanthomonas sp. F37]|uniref:putative quinol monooxygenase n=1 Tax=Pseudoxanthomonas TaxID=83618 RepID=UPI001FD317B8|nr:MULTISPECIES: putative quinol monooxygenase [Pseudoxanthomonas]UOV03619.1 antibiotic biosynthesis monooxygenase [Pseudoxanthomonas mexicana]UOV08616.1 antibiotic biosynthesis monooxygenase [Pseudoxanthomonas sp. F37]